MSLDNFCMKLKPTENVVSLKTTIWWQMASNDSGNIYKDWSLFEFRL